MAGDKELAAALLPGEQDVNIATLCPAFEGGRLENLNILDFLREMH